MPGPIRGRTEEAGMTERLELWVLAGKKEVLYAVDAAAEGRLGVAVTWTLWRGRDEREALLLRDWANLSSARAATSLVAMGRLGLRALLMASRTCASVSFFLRRRSAAAADLAVRSTCRWPDRYELRALSRAGRDWGLAGGMEDREGCESSRLMS
jgi:hypothetical protein